MVSADNKPTKRSRRRTDTKKKKGERYSSFKLQKKIQVDSSDLPSVGGIIEDAWTLLARRKLLIIGITLIYGLSYVLFLRAITGISVSDSQLLLDTITLGEQALLNDVNVALGVLSTTFGVEAGFSGAVGLLSTIVASLAFIYAFRRIHANKPVSLREAYYFGGEQVVPFSIIMTLVVIQLIPFAFGAILLSAVFETDFVIGLGEYSIFLSVWFFLTMLSSYWITNSLMTLYAVSLPKMYPFNALIATAEIIHNRRWIIFRKMLALFTFLLFFNLFFILSAVWLWSGGAYVMRDIGAILSLPIYHAYMFSLYRKLI